MSFVSIAAGIGAVGGLLKIGKGLHQDHLANQVKIPEASYESSPYAAKMLAEATRLKNSQMPGAADATRNIYGNGANAMGSVERNATSGTQALALIGGIQGNTNSAFGGLNQQQNQYAEQQQNNYNNALGTEINEGDKVYQDRVRQQQMAISEKNALRGAGTQNAGGGLNDLANNAFMYGSYQNGQQGKANPSYNGAGGGAG